MFSKSMLRLYYGRVFILALIFGIILLFSYMSDINKLNKCIEINESNKYKHYTSDEMYQLLDKYNINCYCFYQEGNLQYINIEDTAVSVCDELDGFAFSLGLIAAFCFYIKNIFFTYGRKSYSFIGVLPYKRHIHYVNQWLSSILLLVIPCIFGICLCLNIVHSFGVESFVRYMSAGYQLSRLCTAICAFTLFVMLTKLFGNPFYCGIFIGLFLFGLESFFVGVGKLFNYYPNFSLHLEYNQQIIYSLILTLLFFGAGLLLHKIYPVEKTGDVFIYKWLKYVVYIVGSIFGGFGLYAWLDMFMERAFTTGETVIIIALGIAITLYSVAYILKLMENGGNEGENKAFIKIRA